MPVYVSLLNVSVTNWILGMILSLPVSIARQPAQDRYCGQQMRPHASVDLKTERCRKRGGPRGLIDDASNRAGTKADHQKEENESDSQVGLRLRLPHLNKQSSTRVLGLLQGAEIARGRLDACLRYSARSVCYPSHKGLNELEHGRDCADTIISCLGDSFCWVHSSCRILTDVVGPMVPPGDKAARRSFRSGSGSSG